jgi:hypothetical protein
MTPQAQTILRAARIAELKASASSVAALCRPPAAVELPRSRDGNSGRRLLLLLLARERRRNARLVAELIR